MLKLGNLIQELESIQLKVSMIMATLNLAEGFSTLIKKVSPSVL